MKIKLNIHQSNQVKSVDLKEQTVNHVRFEAQSLYQLVDEHNQALEQVFWKKQGDDVLFFLNEHDKQPILVLHDGNDFLAAMHFPQAQTSTLIETVKASQVAAAPNWALLGLGGAVLLGGGLAAAKGGSSSHDKNRADNTSDKAENKNSSSQNNAQKLRDAEIAKQKAEQAQKQAENNLKQANVDLAVALRDKKAAEDALKAAQNSGSKNIADLQKQLDTVNQTVQNAELAKNRAETELANVRNQLKQAENAAQSNKTRLENELNHANTAKEQAQTALQKANADLANALRDKKTAEDNLKAAQEQGSKDIADLQAQLDEANQRVQTAENAQKLAENQAKADKTRLENELNNANENLAAALRDKKTAEDNLKAAQEQGSANIANLQTQLEAANQAVQTAQADKAAAESALTDVRTQLTQAETEKTRLQNELNNTNTAKEQAQTALEKANADLANALRDKKTAEDNLKAAQEQGSKDIADLQAQLDEANQRVQTAENAQKLAENQAKADKTRLENELNNANENLAAALRDKKTAEDNLKAAQEQGSTDIAKLQTQLEAANQAVQTAQADKAAAESALTDVRTQLTQAETEKTRLQNELNNTNTAKEQAQTALEKANADLANALRDKKTAEDNLKAAQEQGSKDIADLQTQLDEANQRVQTAENAQKLAENQAKTDKTRLENELNNANENLAAALRDKKTAEDNLKVAQEQGSTDIANLQTQLEAANQAVQTAQADKAAAESALTDVRTQLTQAETEKTRLQNELNNTNTAKEQVQTALEKANTDLANALRDKKTAEDNLKTAQAQGSKDIADLQAQLDEANQKVQAAEEAKANAETAKNTAESEVLRLNGQLSQANTDLATSLNDKKTAEDNLKAVQEQGNKDIADLQNQLNEANQKVQAAETAKTNTETAKNTAESEVSRLNSQLSQSNTDLAAALNDKKTAEDNLKAVQEQGSKDIADLQNQLKAANDKVKAAATDLSNLRNQFENDLNEAKTAKEKAETDLQTAQNDLANAIAAKEAAEKAQENAENALKAAQEKGEKADALQAQLDTANTTLHEKELALTDAQNAKTLAETQRDDALTAQNTAEKAKEAAEKALADFQAAQAEAIKNNPPQIRFNDLTADNIINSSEASSEIEISGSVNNMQPNDVLNIKIGNTSHIIPVEQGNFALKVNGNLLSDKPVVSAEITRNNEKVADKTHTYEVDTQIDTPIITFNPITEDNIINLDESKQNAIEVSGTVQHFQQGEQLLVKIGETSPIRVAIQDNGTFSFWVAGQTFANHPSIQASLTTKDEAGNTASASKMAEYTVDVIAPTPSITINPIAEDDIINLDESKQETTEISGTVSNVENGKQVMLLCSCQSCSSPSRVVEIPVTVQSDNTFRVSVNTAELLKYDTIKAQIQTQDAAKNTGKNETTKTYRKDLVLNKPEITIDNIENVNRKKWLDNDFRISGSLKTDADVPNQEAQITIKINGQVFAERVSHDGEKWILSVSQNQLQAWDKQTLNVTAEIVVRDEAKNTNNATSESKQFQVSINAAELSIDLNEIGRIQPNQDLAISGKVTGTFKPTDKVIVLVGTTPMANQLDIGSDGQFTGTIAKEHLTGNNTVHVLISGSDDFGNPYENVSDSESYSFPSDNDVILSFNDITGDNHINVTEKSQIITVSGKVSGTYADEQKGKTVNMTVNNQILTATVKDDLSFEFHVSGEDLIRHNGYQLSGSLKDGERTVTALKDYTVAPDALAKIHLNDVNLGTDATIGSVRLSGKLNFNDSMLQYGYNKDVIQALILKIGDKSFTLGVNPKDSTFFLDLTREEYENLKGNAISYKLEVGNYTVKNQQGYYIVDHYFEIKNGNNGKDITWRDLRKPHEGGREIEKITLDFDDINIHKSHHLQFSTDNKTTISGSVEGAKSGDEIQILVGTKYYQATVNDKLDFTVQVDNQDLNAVTEIKATLQSQNAANQYISVSDVGSVLKNIEINNTFTNPHTYLTSTERFIQHTNKKYNFAYFIDSVDTKGNWGLLSADKTPFGGFAKSKPTIKYYFAKNDDYASGLRENGTDAENRPFVDHNTYQEYSSEFKQIVRNAYKAYESVMNVQFEEADSHSEADTVLMIANLINGYQNNSGFAYFGGNLIMDRDYVQVNKFNKHIIFHEILHTLGATHTDANDKDQFNKLDYAKAERTTETSSMSYKNAFTSYSNATDLRIYDLAYLHYRFGVNPNHKTGNDVYGFQDYTAITSDGNRYIWDAAGTDTFDASRENEGVNVNLTPGSWVYRGAISDTFLIKDHVQVNNWGEYAKYFPEFKNENLTGILGSYSRNVYTEGQAFIGYGTQIENLIGSAHADVLKGNKADNNIYGGDGNDQIWGDAGNDYLDGGKGADTLHGGDGNDIFVVDDASDQVHELDNQGTDTIYAHVNYRLSDFVENLSLFGNAIIGDGNALNNTIQGNDLNNTLNGEAGNDRLDGGRGSDTLTGGDGADTFVFSALLDGAVDTITDFTLSEDKIELALNVFSGLAASNLAERIKYDQATGALSYDADGTGNADAIHFATLQNKVDLKIDETHFILA